MRQLLCGDETILYLDYGSGYRDLNVIKVRRDTHTNERARLKKLVKTEQSVGLINGQHQCQFTGCDSMLQPHEMPPWGQTG